MARLGWNMEQRAGIRRYWIFANFFVIIGIILSIFLVAIGNSGGWGLMAFMILIWMVGFFFLRGPGGGRP